jgi:hypothetical protein
MKLLFDECVPRKVKFLFADGGHENNITVEGLQGLTSFVLDPTPFIHP